MVMTVLEARVQEAMWQTLRQTYKSLTATVPDEIRASYLLQDQKDKSTWRIVTIWCDMEALTVMRQSGETPTGVQIFNEAGAKPELSIFDIVDTAPPAI
jgi:quinol monooxygenase YgiN